MHFNVWTFLFEVINFLVLVYILRRLLYRPIQEAVDRRREANEKALADAEKARTDAAALQAQLNAKAAALDLERLEFMRKDREQIDVERKALVSNVEAASRRRREEVERQIAEERAEAQESLKAELIQSAIDLAGRFLHGAVDSSLQKQLAGRLAVELETLPEDRRRRLRDEVQPDDAAVLESSGELENGVLEHLDGALEALFGRRVDLTVEKRPELLGGLRMRIGGHVWDASLLGGLADGAPARDGSVSA